MLKSTKVLAAAFIGLGMLLGYAAALVNLVYALLLFVQLYPRIDFMHVVISMPSALVIGAGWLFLRLNSHGWESNRLLSIGIGGGMGLVMLLNVWGIIWPNNKKIIRGTLAGTPPANAPTLARQAFLASRTNFFLSVPLLFYMAASSHFSSTVIFGK